MEQLRLKTEKDDWTSDLPIPGRLTATQANIVLVALGLLIVFYLVAAGIGCWTMVGWLK